MVARDDYFGAPRWSEGQAVVRRLLLGWAVICLIWLVVAVVMLRPAASAVGLLAGPVLPELVGGVLAIRMARLRRWPFLVVSLIEIVLAAGAAASGDPRGFVQLVVPVVIFVLLLRCRDWHGGRTRDPRSDGQAGASMIEYGALVVVVLVILGGLVAIGIPQQLGKGVRTEVCRIFDGSHCGRTATAAGKDPKGSGGGKKNDSSGKPKKKHHSCSGWGVVSCAWDDTGGKAVHAVKSGATQVAGFGKGVGKSAWQMGKGLVTSARHPSQFVKGISAAIHHPGQAVESIFLGDAAENWKKGNYGEAFGDALLNTGSLFIPYVGEAGKVGRLGKLGQLGKVGEVAKLGDVGELAADGDRAAAAASKAAKAGDVRGAQKAARKAEQDAKKAEEKGREDGCKIGALAPPGAPALRHLGRFGVSMEDGCSSEEQKKIDEAEKAKRKAEEDEHKAIRGSLKRVKTSRAKQLLKKYDTDPEEFKKDYVGNDGAKFDLATANGKIYLVNKDGTVIIDTGYDA